MKNSPDEWKLSIRDGGNRFIKTSTSRPLTEIEKEKIKQEIIEHHESFGLPDELKKELYPELFNK